MSDRFAMVPAAILEDDTLDTYSKMILVALRLHADREGRAFPSLATLARLSGMGKSTIVRKLSELECSGHLRRSKKRLPSGEWAQTEYELLPHPYPREEQEVVSQRDKGCPTAGQEVVSQRDKGCPTAGQGVVSQRDKGCPAASRGLSHSGTLTVPNNIREEKISKPKTFEDRLKTVFAKFWELYPKQTGRSEAFEAFRGYLFPALGEARLSERATNILGQAVLYAKSVAGTEPKYIKNPANWLRAIDPDETAVEERCVLVRSEEPEEVSAHG